MNLKGIGKSESIFLSINENIEDKWFSEISLLINNYNFPMKGKENLSFLCTDFESYRMALGENSLKKYDDDYFWKISNKEIIRLWNKFFTARTIEEMEDNEVEFFDKKIMNSRLPFDSRFLNLWTFVACLKENNWYWKVWKTINPVEIMNFKIPESELISFLDNTTSYLRNEILI